MYIFLVLCLTRQLWGRCRVPSLSTRSGTGSDTILSGTVKSFYMHQSGGPFSGKVRVKRVFRGEKGLEGRMVMVEGFGTDHICLSTPRLGDTKLFFLKSKRVRHNHRRAKTFKLNSNVLKINLRNLKALWKLEAKDNESRIKLITH